MKREIISEIMKTASKIHFVGIGGISMSSLAAITKKNGYTVSGSDRARSSLTEKLSGLGIDIYYSHEAGNIIGSSLIVYTAAVHSDNPELAEAERLGIPTCSRADYLGWLMSGYKHRIGVAGTHGKSTVTSMLAEIFISAGLDPTVVSGAVLSDMGGAYRIGGNDYFIFEACEYCDSFLSFCPTLAVITNIEYDHADYFKDMDQLRRSFLNYINIADTAVISADDKESVMLAEKYDKKTVSFGDSGVTYGDAVFENGCASYDLIKDGKKLCRVSLSVPGKHNLTDSLAAAAASLSLGVSPEAISDGLSRFHGASRRFEYVGKTESGALIYNDYAHHPSELKATLSAAKAFGKRVVSVFQPHTYSRTASLWDDFTMSFADSDITVFSDIYAAREVNTYGVSSEQLANAVIGGVYLPSFEKIAEYLKDNCNANDIIMILGAGDIVKLGEMIATK